MSTTPASFPQVNSFYEKLGKPSSEKLQYLLANGDLLQIMADADLKAVDRQAFRDLLFPHLVGWTPLEDQLQLLRARAPEDVPDSWFDNVNFSRFKPHSPNALPLVVLILPDRGTLDGAWRTYKFYVNQISRQMKNMGHLFDNEQGLQTGWYGKPFPLKYTSSRGRKPGLYVVSFDPTSHYAFDDGDGGVEGSRLHDLWESREVNRLAGPEALAALALTNYGPTMNGSRLHPYMIIGGYAKNEYRYFSVRCGDANSTQRILIGHDDYHSASLHLKYAIPTYRVC